MGRKYGVKDRVTPGKKNRKKIKKKKKRKKKHNNKTFSASERYVEDIATVA